jgi:hypothetical protein
MCYYHSYRCNGGTVPYLNYEFIKVGTPNTQVQFSSNNVWNEPLGGSYIET